MKGSSYEGGYRVPCIARWPGKIPAGHVSAQPAVMMDLFATALKVAGVAARRRTARLTGATSCRCSPAMRRARTKSSSASEATKLATVRDARWKLHVLAPGIGLAASYKPGDHWIDPRAPDGVTILAPYEQAQPERISRPAHRRCAEADAALRSAADPGEQHDVAAQHPDVVQRLAELGTRANAGFESASKARTKAK